MSQYKIYKHCPVALQNFLCSLKGLQLEKQRYGGEYEEIFDSLLDSDNWSSEKIKSYKEEHLFKIIEYAFRNCSFYRKRYSLLGLSPSSFTCLEDLKKFPILTKEDVRENWKEIIADGFPSRELIGYHTSGSTGKALDFYWTKHDLRFYWAVVWRGRHRFGINKGDRHINFTGKIVVPLEQKEPPYWRYNKPMNQYMMNMQHITDSKVEDIVDFINRENCKFFVGYPSIMNTLAMLIDEKGLVVENPPKYIFSSAEKMYDNQRIIIEKVFPGVEIVEHYGFSENAASASKCPDGLYHEDFELGHLELENKEGDTGRMLATGFQNYGMPFIRYQIGDTGTFVDDCDCGLNSQAISDIEGRNGDYVLTPEGAKIMRFGYIFKCTTTIKECQVVQRKLGEMIIRIVPRRDYKKETEQLLISEVRDWISPTIIVKFEYVDSIERTKAGKFKAVVSELDKK